MRQSITRNSAFFAAGGFAAALFLGGAAYAITDATFKYSTPTPRNMMYPAAAFGPRTGPATFSNSGALENTGSELCYVAPVNLPQAAKITSVAMWYRKNDNVADGLALYRINVNTVTLDIVAIIFPSNSNTDYRKAHLDVTDPSLQLVDNNNYTYYLDQCVSSTEAFYAARISYTVTNAGQ
jgi:hypothetical protein